MHPEYNSTGSVVVKDLRILEDNEFARGQHCSQGLEILHVAAAVITILQQC